MVETHEIQAFQGVVLERRLNTETEIPAETKQYWTFLKGISFVDACYLKGKAHRPNCAHDQSPQAGQARYIRIRQRNIMVKPTCP